MKNQLLISVKMLLLMTLLTGLLYPSFMTMVAQALFPYQANGSMIIHDHTWIGSELIGQQFSSDRYFWSRPSAVGYNPVPSGGSNSGPTSETLRKQVNERKSVWLRANKLGMSVAAPAEMLYASASGIDPDISPEAALQQIDRIATVRGFDAAARERLQALVYQSFKMPQFGIFGEPRVNVLQLNLRLDELR